MPGDGPVPLRALERALRRTLSETDGGRLRFDLAGALVDAMIDVVNSQGEPEGNPDPDDGFERDRSVTLADVNAMFALSLGEGCSLALDRFDISFDDRDSAIDEIAGFLVGEWDFLDIILRVATSWSCVASSSEREATMMSDGGIGLYEFTVDDGVYFCTHAELDVEEPRWWFAHTITDAPTRTDAISAGRASLGISDDEN